MSAVGPRRSEVDGELLIDFRAITHSILLLREGGCVSERERDRDADALNKTRSLINYLADLTDAATRNPVRDITADVRAAPDPLLWLDAFPEGIELDEASEEAPLTLAPVRPGPPDRTLPANCRLVGLTRLRRRPRPSLSPDLLEPAAGSDELQHRLGPATPISVACSNVGVPSGVYGRKRSRRVRLPPRVLRETRASRQDPGATRRRVRVRPRCGIGGSRARLTIRIFGVTCSPSRLFRYWIEPAGWWCAGCPVNAV